MVAAVVASQLIPAGAGAMIWVGSPVPAPLVPYTQLVVLSAAASTTPDTRHPLPAFTQLVRVPSTSISRSVVGVVSDTTEPSSASPMPV